MQDLRAKRIRTLQCISGIFVSACLLAGCGQAQKPPQSSALAGLTGVDISQIGPWVLNEQRQFDEVPGLSADLAKIASEHLRGKPIAVGNSNDDAIKRPRLKLFLDYGAKPNLALRGGGQLKSIKLVLEDEVRLARKPPLFVHIVSWSCNRDQAAGATRKQQIVDTFSELLDEFITEYRREQARSIEAPDDNHKRRGLAGNT